MTDYNIDKITYLEKYRLLKNKNFSEIEKFILNQAESENKNIYCKNKCFYCCISYLIGPEIEIELILYYLKKSDYLNNIFMKNVVKWNKKISEIKQIVRKIQAIIPKLSNPDIMRELYFEYLNLIKEFVKYKIVCPFLYKKECIIYPVRPYVCANLVSFSPAVKCKNLTPDRNVYISKIPPTIPNGENKKIVFKPIIGTLYKMLTNDKGIL